MTARDDEKLLGNFRIGVIYGYNLNALFKSSGADITMYKDLRSAMKQSLPATA